MKTNKRCTLMGLLMVGAILMFSSCSKDESDELDPNNIPSSTNAVDLGLSVKWASVNIGASKPEEYGEYYSWGETATKIDYDWTTYKYCSSDRYMIKYSINYGIKDNITTLELDDDVAHIKYGGSWRMPTKSEWQELKFKCEWTWTSKNGVNGYEVRSKTTGNTIFLPTGGRKGYKDTTSDPIFIGEHGYYWSSSLSNDRSYYACVLSFSSDDISLRDEGLQRDGGISVRAVCK